MNQGQESALGTERGNTSVTKPIESAKKVGILFQAECQYEGLADLAVQSVTTI